MGVRKNFIILWASLAAIGVCISLITGLVYLASGRPMTDEHLRREISEKRLNGEMFEQVIRDGRHGQYRMVMAHIAEYGITSELAAPAWRHFMVRVKGDTTSDDMIFTLIAFRCETGIAWLESRNVHLSSALQMRQGENELTDHVNLEVIRLVVAMIAADKIGRSQVSEFLDSRHKIALTSELDLHYQMIEVILRRNDFKADEVIVEKHIEAGSRAHGLVLRVQDIWEKFRASSKSPRSTAQ